MTSQTDELQDRLDYLRSRLTHHSVYQNVASPEDLRIFMENHVFAVWDFMSLLKALQNEFTNTQVPWTPPEHPLAARLMNEIVLAEESDRRQAGGFASHFDLYLEAMREVGASTTSVDTFLEELRHGENLDAAMSTACVPMPARRFVRATFQQISSRDTIEMAAALLYGREDLIPAMFTQVVAGMNGLTGNSTSSFVYYLNRHIELDSDEHGPLASRLMSTLCGTDSSSWKAAEESAVRSLNARLDFWNDIEATLPSRFTSTTWDIP